MGDVGLIVKRLGLTDAVAAKASEYVRVATARLGSAGQFDLCKGAACVELACQTLGLSVDVANVARLSGVHVTVYRNAKAAFQKVLGVGAKLSSRDLCIKFGCARHDVSVRALLDSFKQRFTRSLPAVQQGHVDFQRPVFLAAAFYLVARKHKVAVDRMKLIGPMGVTATEFGQVCASMTDLCPDLVGVSGEARKRQAEEMTEERGALMERTGGANDEDDEASDSEDEVLDEGQVGYRVNAKKQRQREYEEWKVKMLAKPAGGGSSGSGQAAAGASSGGPTGPAGSGSSSGRAAAPATATGSQGVGQSKKAKKKNLTEKKLRQATLCFGGAAAASAEAKAAAAAAAAEPPVPAAARVANGSSREAAAGAKEKLAGVSKGKARASIRQAALAEKNT